MPVPFPEDPYKAIRHACLVETNTESEPFEDPIETETPESTHTVASPTSLPDSTPPTRHDEELKDSDTTSRKAVRIASAMSPGLSASITEVAAMFDSTFCKRFRSSYETSPSSSPLDLSSQNRSWGTSELVEDAEEEDEEEEDEEVEESSDSNSKSEVAGDEGPAAWDGGSAVGDEGPAAGNEGLAAGDEGPVMRVKSLGLGGDEAVPKGQQGAAPIVETTVGEPLGLGYEVLRRREIASREGHMPNVFKVGQSFGSVPEPERPGRVSALRQPTLTTWIDLEDVASPATAEAEGFLTELGAQVEMQGRLIHDHTVQLGELSLALFERYDRDIGELFTSNFWSDLETGVSPGVVAEERRARLDLAEIVASMRRGQEPRGDV
ncbi:hypothetical protein Tco_0895761 [Tanacetum coccineum]|uniref:Uncharacterized protein n=1 Tax=Tanacetum coccineum TaxID=301880 RepID=A0ABQ5CLR6_9ASTR